MSPERLRSFPPVAAPGARVLVLGSMPGRASLEAGQYYAHPHNAFWPILCALLEVDPQASYDLRTQALETAGIALWDVLRFCSREGSLDAAIDPASEVPNDLPGLLERCPAIHSVFFNGAKAEQSFRRHLQPLLDRELRLTRLPSTSPAHASLRPDQKLERWRVVVDAARGRDLG